ncbi:hypothetical protein ACFXKF_32660 [Streptomyces scopuliridis]|uniref:hypothetical protein n=1 Tax=Streptomyces scopuliridis TaxID=452529 RepID=UPI0036B7F6F5
MTSRPTLLQRLALRRAVRDLTAAEFEDLDEQHVAEHLGYVTLWRRGTLPAHVLAARTGWKWQGDTNRSIAAASVFVDAKEALGAAMADDVRDGLSEDDVLRRVGFALPQADARRLLHSSQVLADALDAAAPWLEAGLVHLVPKRDGPLSIFAAPSDEASGTDALTGLDEALAARGLGMKDPGTNTVRKALSLTAGGAGESEIYRLPAPADAHTR